MQETTVRHRTNAILLLEEITDLLDLRSQAGEQLEGLPMDVYELQEELNTLPQFRHADVLSLSAALELGICRGRLSITSNRRLMSR